MPRNSTRIGWLAPLVACGVALSGCHDEAARPGESIPRRTSLDQAYCRGLVVDAGVLDVEDEYLPRVVMCENGAGELAALKAQAVAARSYLYYRLDRDGIIGDGQYDQVYGCGKLPSPQVRRAVRETSGQVLMYHDTQVAAFYVAGAIPSDPVCAERQTDPTRTEPYVTYNRGRRGDRVRASQLGWIHVDNHANRGCMSQNGANCLASAGWSYEDILRFYYGDDIELVTMQGECVARPASGWREGSPDRGGVRSGRVVASLLVLLVTAALCFALRDRIRRAARKRRRRRAR